MKFKWVRSTRYFEVKAGKVEIFFWVDSGKGSHKTIERTTNHTYAAISIPGFVFGFERGR